MIKNVEVNNIKVGRILKMKEKPWTFNSSTGKIYTGVSYEVDDPEFNKEIKDLNIRVLTPGAGGTCDWQPTRLNVEISKGGIITGVYYG